MDFSFMHDSFIQPVIKELFIATTFKHECNQISFNRQVFSITRLFTSLNMQLYNPSQIRIVTVPGMAPVAVIEQRYLFAFYFQYCLINHNCKVSNERLG